MNYLTPILLLVWFTFIVLLWNHKAITKAFHLVDSRTYISSEETYQKLNKLFEWGDTRISTIDLMDGTTIFLNVEYGNGVEKTEGTFKGENMDQVINEAYAWSVERGFIKD